MRQEHPAHGGGEGAARAAEHAGGHPCHGGVAYHAKHKQVQMMEFLAAGNAERGILLAAEPVAGRAEEEILLYASRKLG